MSNIKIAFVSLAGLAALAAVVGFNGAMILLNPAFAAVNYVVACL